MSKIICDVCGTSYPETAQQCPICGCARPGDAKPVATENGEAEVLGNNNYTYVKGGRFSKSNVKKRNQGTQAAPEVQNPISTNEPKKIGKVDAFLVAVVVVLLIAIVAVVSYIAMRVFFPDILSGANNNPISGLIDPNTNTTTQETTEETTLPIPCGEVTLSKTEIEFDKEGAVVLLNATLDPKDTTDKLEFTSSDTSVVTVTSDGKVEAVGPGEAVITATCGEFVAECKVLCTFTVPETTGEATEPTYSTDDFKLNRSDFTLNRKGDTHILYAGNIPVESITWTTDDANVATIENGKVTAVGTGNTKVYAEYRGIKLSAIVRCAASVGTPATNTTQDASQSANTPYNINKTDVTITVDGEFKLQLLDANRKAVSVTWTVADASICSVSGSTVKGLKAGRTTVSVTHEGYTYSCIVRVK